MAFLKEPLSKRENWTIKGNARRYRESSQSFSCWFGEKLSKNKVLVPSSPQCYLTMEHSTEFFLDEYTLGNILKNTSRVASAKTE